MKKDSVKILLFDSIPIKNYILSLLHAAIGVENKIVHTYFDQIDEKIEPITVDELELTNFLIDLKIELNKYEQDYDEWINNYSSLLVDLRLENKIDILFLLIVMYN